MAGSPIRKILKVGLQNTVPLLKYRQILVTNYLSFIFIVSLLVMSVLVFYFDFREYFWVCLTTSFLYLPVFYFNHQNYYRTASVYFFIVSLALGFILAVISIVEGMQTGVEYIFLPVLAIYLLMFDGKTRHLVYWTMFLVLFGLKVFDREYNDHPYSVEFFIYSLNLFFIALLLSLFINFFKGLLFKALQKTNQHERTLYSLLDNVPIYMALVDKNGTYKIANRLYSEQFGLDRDEIIGRKRGKVLPENIFEQHEPYFQEAMDGRDVPFLEENLMPGGTVMQSKGKYVPILNEDGEVEAVTIYVDDVTELVETELSLKRANETKDKLFSIVAHDIRSPLNLFESMLNVSQDEIITKEEFFHRLEEVRSKLNTLRERLDELLDWARMQMGGINAYPQQVDINSVIDENIELFHELSEAKKVELDTDLEEGASGWIDENHLKIVVRNLVHNAIKFSESGKSITINTSEDEDSFLVEIIDQGKGMSQEMVDSIIKKEVQKSVTGTSGEVGTGLGLSLSLGLLEKNKCIVSLESKVGQGTTFRIWIPKENTEV